MTIDTMISPAEDQAAWQAITRLKRRAVEQLQAGCELIWTL